MNRLTAAAMILGGVVVGTLLGLGVAAIAGGSLADVTAQRDQAVEDRRTVERSREEMLGRLHEAQAEVRRLKAAAKEAERGNLAKPALPPPTGELKELVEQAVYKDGSQEAKIAGSRALERLVAMGPKAKAAIPFLVAKAIRDGDGTKALAAIGPAESIPFLVEALEAPNDADRRYMAAQILRSLADGDDGKAMSLQAAVPALKRSLDMAGEAVTSDETMAATMAADTLTRVDPEGRDVLLQALRSPNAKIRRAAAWALPGKLSRDSLVEPLMKALGDEDREVRGQAAYGLGRIGPAAKRAAPALHQALQRETELGVKMAIAGAITKVAPESASK
jgi:HEAT repeat protein